MRRSCLGKLSNPTIGNATKYTLRLSSPSAFSTSADGGGGGGRGRGRGSDDPNTRFSTPGITQNEDESPFPSGFGHGQGRGGKPLPSPPIISSFSSFVSGVNSNTTTAGPGRGRGGGGVNTTITPPQFQSQSASPRPQEPPPQHSGGPKKPIFFLKEDASESFPKTPIPGRVRNAEVSNLPSSILSVLSGAGRGKPAKSSNADEKIEQENRHIRAPEQRSVFRGRGRGGESIASVSSTQTPRLSREEAVKKAVGILSRGGGEEDGGRGRGGFRGRGRRGRGGRGVRDWRGGRERRGRDAEEDYGSGLYLGDGTNGEELAKRLGPENMNKLVEGFEEMSGRVLPSPLEDAYLDGFHTNMMIECEPEYLMEEFGTNPDIDEKPPISLQDALEKMKPFLMAYEGIQNQEEWEVHQAALTLCLVFYYPLM
ncbi:unnamed protein product [Ilex paraguariensis]|uniref:Uncharacterized protein n=1 Tax=Ilex paraguariensis TaxID=185542 RepID=A0ABC8T4L4_9AQUA